VTMLAELENLGTLFLFLRLYLPAFLFLYVNDNNRCWPNSDESCIVTIANAITFANIGGTTTQAQGCDVNSQNTSKFDEAITLVKDADIAVLVLGNDRSVEHEGLDRPDTVLSGMSFLLLLPLSLSLSLSHTETHTIRIINRCTGTVCERDFGFG
jgi:hypothetical protein